jgi:hypothetical protein
MGIDVADFAVASAAPFAGMTQTGSMGLISAARWRGTPVPLNVSSPVLGMAARPGLRHDAVARREETRSVSEIRGCLDAIGVGN